MGLHLKGSVLFQLLSENSKYFGGVYNIKGYIWEGRKIIQLRFSNTNTTYLQGKMNAHGIVYFFCSQFFVVYEGINAQLSDKLKNLLHHISFFKNEISTQTNHLLIQDVKSIQ